MVADIVVVCNLETVTPQLQIFFVGKLFLHLVKSSASLCMSKNVCGKGGMKISMEMHN